MKPLLLFLAAVAVNGGCMSDQHSRLAHVVDSLRRAGARDRVAASGRRDPCTLLAGTDAEEILGPLRHEPYRVDGGGNPDPDGSSCRFEAQTGRHVIMEVTFEGALIGMRAIGLGVQIASPVLGNDSARLASVQGHWDETHLLPGHFMARKGDAMVDVGYLGSRAGLGGAAHLADLALGRVAAPLPYDGASAARTAPGPLVTPRDPCSLVPRADAEAIVGRLARDPQPDAGLSSCTFTLATRRSLAGQQIQLMVQWRDGFAALEGSRSTAALVERQVGGMPAGGDTALGRFMQQVGGAMRSQGIGAQLTDSGLKTDSTVAGPWDEASLVAGLEFSAVKEDVLLSVDLRTIPYDQARALVAKAAQHL
jgi:hypothetical protein